MIQSLVQHDEDIATEEFELIEDEDHIEEVWEEIGSNFSGYSKRFFADMANRAVGPTRRDKLLAEINAIVKRFEKERNSYEEFFERQKFFEQDSFDTGTFKNQLKRNCTIIRAAVNSKSDVMKDWKIAFNRADSQMLYDVFRNLVEHADEYDEETADDLLADTWEDLELEWVSSDECNIRGVVSTGINSTILNYLYPNRFPGHFKVGVYALYFLAGKKIFDMPSATSEFVVVKDLDQTYKSQPIPQEHNFYFPYPVFSLYAYRIFDELAELLKTENIEFPLEYKYVLTNEFFSFVYDSHQADIATLRASDDLDKYRGI